MEGPDRYTRVAMLLHWTMAVLIVGNVALILAVDRFPDAMVRPVIDTHKSIGITVLGLAVLRLLWRITHRPPALPTSFPGIERRTAHAVHWLLYGVIFALPLSGWIHDSAYKDAATTPLRLFGLVPWPRITAIMAIDPVTKERLHAQWFDIHVALAWAIGGLVTLHVLGAMKHQVFDKDRVLSRMLPWGRARR